MNASDEKILFYADTLLKRRKLSVFLDWLMEILFFLVYGSALIFVIERIISAAFTDKPYLYISNSAVIVTEAIFLALSAVISAVLTADYFKRGHEARIRAAKTADNKLGLQDRFSSVVEFVLQGRKGPMAELAIEDAEGLVNRINTRVIIRLPRVNYRWGILPGYLTIVLIILFTPDKTVLENAAGPTGKTQEMSTPEEEALKTLDVPITILKPKSPGLFGEPDRAEGAKRTPKIVDPLVGEVDLRRCPKQ